MTQRKRKPVKDGRISISRIDTVQQTNYRHLDENQSYRPRWDQGYIHDASENCFRYSL